LNKYLGKIDKNNRFYCSVMADQSKITLEQNFLHNMKITSSAINEQALAEKRREETTNIQEPTSKV
jgi:hypothetical protein